MIPRPISNDSGSLKSKKLESCGPCFAGDCADGGTASHSAVASPTPTVTMVLFILRPPGKGLRFRLIRDAFGGGGRGFRVAEIVMTDRFEILMQLVDQRNASGDVQLDDLRL